MKHRWSLWLVLSAFGALAVVLAAAGWRAYSLYAAYAAAAATAAAEAQGEYFRVTARYIYQGVPMTLDYGVACGATVRISKPHGGSWLMYGGPLMYGARTHDNKVLVVSTRSLCASTRGIRVVKNYFPAVIIYDDPNTLSQGYAYVSEDAFDRAGSPLKFLGADVVEIPSVAAFKEFASSQAPNAVSMFNSEGRVLGNDAYPATLNKLPVAHQCSGWWRAELPEKVRAQFRTAWPKHRPLYWALMDDREVNKLVKAFEDADPPWGGGDKGPTYRRVGQGPSHEGLVRRDGTGNAWNDRQGQWHAVFRHSERYPEVIKLKQGEPFEAALDIKFRPDSLGLYYCGHWAETYEHWQANKQRVGRRVRHLPEGFYSVNGTPIDGLRSQGPVAHFFFEADTHIWGIDELTISTPGEQGSGR